MPKTKKAGCLPKTAVAYARYSSAGQRDVSVDQQLQDIRELLIDGDVALAGRGIAGIGYRDPGAWNIFGHSIISFRGGNYHKDHSLLRLSLPLLFPLSACSYLSSV